MVIRKIPENGAMRRYAEAINQLSKAVAASQIQRGKDYFVHRTAHGQTLQIRPPRSDAKDGSVVQKFQIIELHNDYLSCRKVGDDGKLNDNDTTVYLVAKPTMLQVAKQDGMTILLGPVFRIDFDFSDALMGETRRLRLLDRNPPYIIYEKLHPAYFIGAQIYACETNGKPEVTVNGQQLTWMDMNVDARHYRPMYERVAVCQTENGQTVTRYMYVAGGHPQQ